MQLGNEERREKRNKEGPIFEKKRKEIKASAYGKTIYGAQQAIIIKERRADPKLPPLLCRGDALIIFSEAHSPQIPSSKKNTLFFFFCSVR